MEWAWLWALLIFFLLAASRKQKDKEVPTERSPPPNPLLALAFLIPCLLFAGGMLVMCICDMAETHSRLAKQEAQWEERFQTWSEERSAVRVIGGKGLVLCEVQPTGERFWFGTAHFRQPPKAGDVMRVERQDDKWIFVPGNEQ
jgi:hypothetical protein